MSKEIDYRLADAGALKHSISENREALRAKGFSEAKETKLVNFLITAIQKTAAQTKAEKLINDLTGQQNEAFKALLLYIKKAQSAAKSAFGGNKALLKKFRIGDAQPKGVKTILTWAEYFTGVIFEYETELLENGWVEGDSEEFENRHQALAGIDARQESAKSLKSAATITRDKAVKDLKEEVIRFRSFVKAAFAGEREMIVRFKAIPKM